MMDKTQLQRQLETLAVRPDSYSIDAPSNESYCLEQIGDNWVVYYYERGIESGKIQFDSENEACEYFLELLKNDPSTKL